MENKITGEDRVQIRVSGESDVARCVLEAGQMATRIGFSENAQIMIVTSVSELSRNIMKYAGTGTILMSPIRKGDQAGMEVVARDHGPGISNIEEAMADHFSSGGTLGLGLPGVRRLMDEFEIESASKLGTQVVCRKWC